MSSGQDRTAAQGRYATIVADTAAWAFTDALLALSELDHADVAERLAARWPEVKAKP